MTDSPLPNSASNQKVNAQGQSAASTGATDTRPSKGGAAPTTTTAPKSDAKPKAPKAPKAEGEAGRGRKSQYSGMTLKATVEANPRREGSHGFKSLALILAAGKSGISYEDYIAKGGRLNDLVWDINKDHVLAEKAKAA